MNKYKKLISGSLILLLGSMGSKFGSLFLLPIYTHYLSVSDYGIADLSLTFINFLLPILTLSIFEMFIKKIIEEPSKKLTYFVSATGILLGTNLVVWFISHIAFFLGVIHLKYRFFFMMLFLMTLQSYTNLILNYLRAINKNNLYALTNIFQMIMLIVSSIILLEYFNLGLLGFLFSNIISSGIVLSNIYLIFKDGKKESIKFNKNFILELIRESLPLIPNALMWWGINSADKIFIVFFLGTSASGLFAAANKLPMFLTMIGTVFFQSWQVSAIEEANNENANEFYANVFKYFVMFMELGVLTLTILINPICNILLSNSFTNSIQYVPFLILATYFSNISSFLGANCIAYGETKFIFKSSIICCVVNIILSPIFISILGLHGAGISATISFILLSILRFTKVKSFVDLGISIIRFIGRTTLVVLSVTLFVLFRSISPLIVLVVYIVWANNAELISLVSIGVRQMRRYYENFNHK